MSWLKAKLHLCGGDVLVNLDKITYVSTFGEYARGVISVLQRDLVLDTTFPAIGCQWLGDIEKRTVEPKGRQFFEIIGYLGCPQAKESMFDLPLDKVYYIHKSGEFTVFVLGVNENIYSEGDLAFWERAVANKSDLHIMETRK